MIKKSANTWLLKDLDFWRCPYFPNFVLLPGQLTTCSHFTKSNFSGSEEFFLWNLENLIIDNLLCELIMYKLGKMDVVKEFVAEKEI